MARHGYHINRKGYREVLNGPDAFDICDRIGASWEGRLGDGYTHDTMRGKNRIHTWVKTVGGGFYKEAKTHALRRLF